MIFKNPAALLPVVLPGRVKCAWHGRENSGGSWLPEDIKANMWHGRGNSGGSLPLGFPRSQDRPMNLNHVFQQHVLSKRTLYLLNF